MTDATKRKLGMAIGGAAATAGGAIGGPIGAAIAILSAAVLGWNGYKLESPREVWTPEKREAYRKTHGGNPPQEYDDEEPAPYQRR